MWGNPRPPNRIGPFRGSQEERFAPGWNRDYSPPLDSLTQERHSGNFSGRESLPFDIQGHPGILNPQFANREEPAFSFGGRDGPRSDFRGGEGHVHDFGGRDYPPPDFQNRDDTHLDFRGRVPLHPDFRGREMYPGNFQDREGQSMEYSGGDIPPMDFRNRDAFCMNYRDREAHKMNYRGRNDAPSDFHGRGSFDLDFRSRDVSHPQFRTRDTPEQDFRVREQPYSDFRKRDMPDMDLMGMGAADLDFRDRDVPHSNFRNRPKSQVDQDFRGRDVPPPLDFVDREIPSVDPNVVDFQQSQSTVPLTDKECKIEDVPHAVRETSSFTQKEECPHPEPGAGEEESQGQHLEINSSLEFQNSRGSLPPLQDQDKSSQTFVNNQEFPGGEQQVSESSGLEMKGKDDLDFLGRQDTDYRGIEYRDVDHRLPGNQIFDYEHGKSFADGKSCKDSPPEFQDQDYRTCLKDVKPSKLIRLGRVPETATKDDILNAFQECGGTTVKNLRLKDYTTVSESKTRSVWICGHTVVHSAGCYAKRSAGGAQLGLGEWLHITWLGQQGMRWERLIPLLLKEADAHGPPDILVIHLGENDLCERKSLDIRNAARRDLEWCKQQFPDTKIIWSELLERREWQGARSIRRVDVTRKKFNSAIRTFVITQGDRVIRHQGITYKQPELYEPDGVELSDAGIDIWLSDLRAELVNLLQLPVV